jgi:hypothetical protein
MVSDPKKAPQAKSLLHARMKAPLLRYRAMALQAHRYHSQLCA